MQMQSKVVNKNKLWNYQSRITVALKEKHLKNLHNAMPFERKTFYYQTEELWECKKGSRRRVEEFLAPLLFGVDVEVKLKVWETR